jgi:hypothetical protein
MLRRLPLLAGSLTLAALLLAPALGALAQDAPATVALREFTLSDKTMCDVKQEWMADILATHPEGGWVPLRVELTDSILAKMGLPDRAFLFSHRFPTPTLVTQDGQTFPVDLPPVDTAATGASGTASYAGAGCLGIRPGAWLLTVTSSEIGWCSMAHVYGTPGSYEISTAGHCGARGDTATVIAATGNRAGAEGVVLLDFGKYVSSTGDAGIGKDWALIGIDSAWQRLVSPTMCEWGGPIGTYTKTGAVVEPTWKNGLPTGFTTTPDPTLASQIVHYGHGAGAGAGGTGRVGQVLDWRSTDYAFVGTITPGDSGSGSNALLGDAVGAEREAAGINTHLYVGTSLWQQDGLGIMAGTRATQVQATLANGQLIPYPAPVPGAP